jgi:hypothetical protein
MGAKLLFEFSGEVLVEGMPALLKMIPKCSSGRSARIRLWIAFAP